MRLPAPARWTLLRKFTVLSLVCFAALGVALSQLLGHQIRERALSNTVASAQLLSSTIANGQLRPSDLTGRPMEPARRAALDATFAQARAQNRLARLKVWSRSGQIVYSDDHAAIGKKFEVEDDLKEAFAGDTHSAIREGGRAAGGAQARDLDRGVRSAALRLGIGPAGGGVRDLHAVRAGRGGRRARRSQGRRPRGRRPDASVPAALPDRRARVALAAPAGGGEPPPGPARSADRSSEPALALRTARLPPRHRPAAVAARGRPRRLQGAERHARPPRGRRGALTARAARPGRGGTRRARADRRRRVRCPDLRGSAGRRG